MRRKILFLAALSLLQLSSMGQVKEFDFFGKSWYLHGIDARLIFSDKLSRISSESVNENQRVLFTAISEKYEYNILLVPDAQDIVSSSDFGFSTGLVLKPFYKSTRKILQSAEVIHDVGISKERYVFGWADIKPLSSDLGNRDATYINSVFFYRLGINVSSRAVLNRVKFYGGINLRLATSNRTSFELKEYAIEGLFGSTNINPNSNLNLNLSKREMGAGYTAGLKLAATCYFNVHCELQNMYLSSWYRSAGNERINYSSLRLKFGFRYKFAGPMPIDKEEQQQEEEKAVFW